MSHFVAYVKWLFRHRNYCFAQFVDDFVLACDDLRFLVDSLPRLEKFLRGYLVLTMHKDKRYLQPVSHGVLFVGSFIKPGRLYLSNRTVARLKEHCEGYDKMVSGQCDTIDLQHIECTLNSYLGFCKRRRTYKFRKSLMSDNLYDNFYVKGHYESVRLKRKYRPITI
jgi:hypothetical protein